MRVLICGGGQVGALISRRLIREGNEVTLVDPDPARCEELESTLDAHVVVTTSMAIDPADLKVPANAHVVRYADHNAILARADLCVTHGGHGTMMRAFKHGVPMVVVPGFPHDQAPNAGLVDKLGVGLALPGDADAAALKNAAIRILKEPSFESRAKDQARTVQQLDGASTAADIMEAIASDKTTAPVS